MHHLGLIVIVASAAAVLIVGFAVILRRSERAQVIAQTGEPRSLVRVLTTKEAIADAARRAASFERNVAVRSSERAEHYEALAADRAFDATVHDIVQRSA